MLRMYAYTRVAHEGGFALDRFPAVTAWLARVRAEPRHVAIGDEVGVRIAAS
jgi:glutathione S-transferase